jgi:hypothetical protein
VDGFHPTNVVLLVQKRPALRRLHPRGHAGAAQEVAASRCAAAAP